MTSRKHLLSVEHIDPRNGVLVCGLCNELNEVIADYSYNSVKTNRFVPYRIGAYPAPVNPGDLCEFLIGADIETDSPGEWVVCEFMERDGVWWQESNRIGNGSCEGGRRGLTTTLLNNPNHQSEAGRLGGQKTIGQMLAHPNYQESRQRAGQAAYKAGLGEFTKSEEGAQLRSENGKKLNRQRWMSTDPNWPAYVSTPGPLSNWQKARGIDTSMRVRVE